MKRILSALLALGLLLSACAAPPEPAEPELIVVGISQSGAESDWRVANSESMKAVFTEENGYRLLFDDARQKQENQITAVRKFIQQQVDYIVLMPIQETGWDSVLEEARDANIPVILVDRRVDVADDGLYAAHIGSDFALEGRRAVAWIETAFPDETRAVNILHLRGTLGSTAQLGRSGALEDAAARHGNWTLLAQLDSDFTYAKAYEVIDGYLDARPPLDVIYCENDNAAFAALEALTGHGYACGPNGVQVISFDATRSALEACLDGRIALAVECNPLLGPLVEGVVQALERGETPPKHSYVEEAVFTAEDLTLESIQARAY
ncbi:MAG: substrate-binding domain-containing protein [Oscillospiraceae bacterium]|nr:substrate-binding domain-containing protein [Oscillospiraceae bacterium]